MAGIESRTHRLSQSLLHGATCYPASYIIIRAQKLFHFYRSYKKDWEKFRIEKEAQRKKTEKEQLEKASKKAMGETVSFVTTINSGRDTSEIYLKHACNESSDDEDGTENNFEENETEEKEPEESFRHFLERHKMEQAKRKSNQEFEPNTSKN